MTSRISRLAACVLILLALVAASCGSDDADTADTPEASEPAEAEATAAPAATEVEEEPVAQEPVAEEPVAEEDAMTEEETVVEEDAMAEDVAMRIVSLSPSSTEMLFAIGAGDKVVAVDAFSTYPAEAPVTDLSAFDLNLEALTAFDPDLVVSSGPLEGVTELGIENLVAGPATDLEDIYAQIADLGVATGHIDEAAALVTEMRNDIDEILALAPDRDIPLSFYHELDNTLYSATSSTFIGYVYGLFGLRNVADAADEDGSAFGFPQLNEEFLVVANPDIIFLADTLCCEQNAETVAARPGWDLLGAVRAGNIVELDDDVASRWGPRIVDFIATIGAAVTELEPVPVS